MGYYTTFHADIVLKQDIPDNLAQLLALLIPAGVPDDVPLPTHPLFKCYRWGSLFSKSAFLEESPLFIQLPSGYYHLSIRAVFQNKDDEISKFLHWITPFVAGHKKQTYVGWQKGEDGYSGRINLYINKQ